MNGYGTIYYINSGHVFQGDFNRDRIHPGSDGIDIFLNGDVYEGMWHKECMFYSCHGKLTSNDGKCVYKG